MSNVLIWMLSLVVRHLFIVLTYPTNLIITLLDELGPLVNKWRKQRNAYGLQIVVH